MCDCTDYRHWFKDHQLALPHVSISDLLTPGQEDIVAEGDKVAVVLSWPDGKEAQSKRRSGVVIYRVAGGAIQESWWTWDTKQLLLAAEQQRSDESQPIEAESTKW